jgi:hypothetical protein
LQHICPESALSHHASGGRDAAQVHDRAWTDLRVCLVLRERALHHAHGRLPAGLQQPCSDGGQQHQGLEFSVQQRTLHHAPKTPPGLPAAALQLLSKAAWHQDTCLPVQKDASRSTFTRDCMCKQTQHKFSIRQGSTLPAEHSRQTPPQHTTPRAAERDQSLTQGRRQVEVAERAAVQQPCRGARRQAGARQPPPQPVVRLHRRPRMVTRRLPALQQLIERRIRKPCEHLKVQEHGDCTLVAG